MPPGVFIARLIPIRGRKLSDAAVEMVAQFAVEFLFQAGAPGTKQVQKLAHRLASLVEITETTPVSRRQVSFSARASARADDVLPQPSIHRSISAA
jgi:hypothetical protein